MDLSNDDESFEQSHDPKFNQRLKSFENKPYDEALEFSQDSEVPSSLSDKKSNNGKLSGVLKNQKYDEALELSQSVVDPYHNMTRHESKNEPQKTTPVPNRPFDEAMEFSHSDDDDNSVDTDLHKITRKTQEKTMTSSTFQPVVSQSKEDSSPSMPVTNNKSANTIPTNITQASASKPQPANINNNSSNHQKKSLSESKNFEESESAEEEDDDDGEFGTSYENLEGAYDAHHYENLNIGNDIKEIFAHINRYIPHEIALVTTLKCFIPEYMPTIGDIDSFIKIPRPDGKPDELGLKYIDEPSMNQSDATVLELQLRAMTKKVQNNEMIVRSIEDASKNPIAIDKWIKNITELHASKPPPQVIYKHNYPDSETLMQIWPENFEMELDKIPLPSPDLDLSLADYSKVLCTLLDIPVYDNPIESLHVMFNLYLDFKNNPHFQNNLGNTDFFSGGGGGSEMNAYGGADVMEIEQASTRK